ncbi:MAG: F0F1 ATP synthase subunit delta [Treponema sp.]|jgi:F-type H+-transporting ATPase subunit delta|nr:F0F1 ATP synthase subunit delta [Treponema sp.]
MFRADPWAEAFIAGAGAGAREALEYFRLYWRGALGLPGYLSGRGDAAAFDRALGAALERCGGDSPANGAFFARRFMLLVIRKNRLAQCQRISAAVEQKLDSREGIINVDLVTAFEAGNSFNSFIDELKRILAAKKNAAGVTLRAHTNQALIGGFVVRIGSEVYDASIASRLKELFRQT